MAAADAYDSLPKQQQKQIDSGKVKLKAAVKQQKKAEKSNVRPCQRLPGWPGCDEHAHGLPFTDIDWSANL